MISRTGGAAVGDDDGLGAETVGLGVVVGIDGVDTATGVAVQALNISSDARAATAATLGREFMATSFQKEP